MSDKKNIDVTKAPQRQALRRQAETSMVPANYIPGSLPLRNRVHERYCRLRAQSLPQALAYREAQRTAYRFGTLVSDKKNAAQQAIIIEKRQQIAQRIQYLTQSTTDIIQAKRQRLEEQLWRWSEADIGDYFETVEIDGKLVQRPKLLQDISTENRKNIEKINIDGRGRIVPQLYSAPAANAELRRMLEIGGKSSDQQGVYRMSDAELLSQLADLSKQLGVEMKLDVAFAGSVQADAVNGPLTEQPSQVIDNVDDDGNDKPIG